MQSQKWLLHSDGSEEYRQVWKGQTSLWMLSLEFLLQKLLSDPWGFPHLNHLNPGLVWEMQLLTLHCKSCSFVDRTCPCWPELCLLGCTDACFCWGVYIWWWIHCQDWNISSTGVDMCFYRLHLPLITDNTKFKHPVGIQPGAKEVCFLYHVTLILLQVYTNNCAFVVVVVVFCEAVLKICPCWKQPKKTIKKSTLHSKRLRTVCISVFTALLAQARRTSYLYVNHWTNLCFIKLASNDCC